LARPRRKVSAAPDLAQLVPIPPKDVMNVGLSAAREDTMLGLLGVPGRLTRDCSDPTGPIVAQIVTGVDVGRFVVSGFRLAVESLRLVLAEVSEVTPDVYRALESDGMLCVRARRHNPARFSNHSWGTAIDLFFGAEATRQGTPFCQRGFLDLFGPFNRHGWYWGAEFSGDSVDSMHFEIAQETILEWGHPLGVPGLVVEAEPAPRRAASGTKRTRRRRRR